MFFLKAYGSIEETLLLEFTYYGKLTKEHPNAKTLDPFEYLPKGIEDIEIIEETPVEETDKINKTKSSAGKNQTDLTLVSNGDLFCMRKRGVLSLFVYKCITTFVS